MDATRFNEIVEKQITWCKDILLKKAKEYGAVDRLHNFKIASGLQQVPKEQALAGMMTKHIVSIYDMSMSGKEFSAELWNEKIGDSINYLLILRALIEEDPTKIVYDKEFKNPDLQTMPQGMSYMDEELPRGRTVRDIHFKCHDAARCVLEHLNNLVKDGPVDIATYYTCCNALEKDLVGRKIIIHASDFDRGWDNFDEVTISRQNSLGWTINLHGTKLLREPPQE